MNEVKNVPYIPDTAPFSGEQRAYLNGFFAGLFSRVAPPDPSARNGEASPTLQPLTILFGSQTGNAEALAKRVAKEGGRRAFAPIVYDMAQYPFANLKTEKNLLLITSTYGDGDPPDNAKAFWEFLSNGQAPSLSNLNFSVLALGDSNYPKFCACGKSFDQRLEQLGAHRAHPRVDCDVDYEGPFCAWLQGVLPSLNSVARVPQLSTLNPQPTATYSRSNPFSARLVTNRVLNAPWSAKETRHFEIAIEGLTYEVGDALGVIPANCPQLVDEILSTLGGSGDESLRKSLLQDYDVTKISQLLIVALAERSGDEHLKKLASPTVNGELKKFLWGREVIDLLLAYPHVKWTPTEFVKCLKKLQPRLYSISSSPKAHSKQVHLTISTVRYESLGRARKGVCSSFLADRVCQSTPLPVFVHTNKNFRLPQDSTRPLIMVGPGTGIAPFRAFLHDRRASGAKGKTWLFFGDQHEETDFLYRDELQDFLRNGTLTRLTTAFSRDQADKIYVQHRMLEHAPELFQWLQDGAYFYVCGDATRMAKDVDSALHQIIPEAAVEYVKRLRDEKRYLRDVY
jgi:sulfite reductase (NADPH) flavoprotein alpha-component